MWSFYHYPYVVFLVALAVQWFGAFLGHFLRVRGDRVAGAERGDINVILGATLTLLALIIGFTFSMAITRYEERKGLEEAEANAVRTAYLRADLLPAGAAERMRGLMAAYARQRLVFYDENDAGRLARARTEAARLQDQMWSLAAGAAVASPNDVTSLAVTAMNDVQGAEGRTIAAWGNHIPIVAWFLMLLIAFAGNVLLGASEKRRASKLLVVLPLIVSVPFLLIDEIDSPRAGLIRVHPVNLVEVARAMAQRP
jgi:hypothetical protein